MEGIERSQSAEPNERVLSLERQLAEILPMHEIIDIFGKETFLIGGFLRDLALGKNLVNSDFDLMTRMPREKVTANLQRKGYIESDLREFEEEKYSFNSGGNIINLMLKGRKLEVGFVGQLNPDTLISHGDITRYLIDLAQKAGLKLIKDPVIIERILTNNNPEYKDRILIEERGRHVTFLKKRSDDTKQVLLVS